jgi:hypothetical protein
MALQPIELAWSKFLYRCDACPFEFPKDSVSQDKLGIAPRHDCPNQSRVNIDEIMDRQTN